MAHLVLTRQALATFSGSITCLRMGTESQHGHTRLQGLIGSTYQLTTGMYKASAVIEDAERYRQGGNNIKIHHTEKHCGSHGETNNASVNVHNILQVLMRHHENVSYETF